MKNFPNGNRPTRSIFIFLLFLALTTARVYAQAPEITGFRPFQAPIGTSVTINGTGFNTTPANNIVFFGAVRATVTAASATSLTVTVPPPASDPIVTVINTGTGLQTTGDRYLITFIPGKSIAKTDFSAKVDFPTGTNPRALEVRDIDGDGKPDLVIANFNDNTVSVLLNTGSPGSVSFAAKVDLVTGKNPVSIAVGDIDGDGKPDLVVANKGSNTVSVLLNTSSPGHVSFAAKTDLPTGSQPVSVAIGDLSVDGKPDIAVVNFRSNTVSVLLNNSTPGNISFAAKVDMDTGPGPVSLAIADYSGDGRLDMIIGDQGSNAIVYLMNASRPGVFLFYPVSPYSTPATDPLFILIADINGDSQPELVVAPGTNKISVQPLPASCCTGYSAAIAFATGNRPVSVAAGDIDGDGRPELVTANANSQTVSVLRNASTVDSFRMAGKIDLATGLTPFAVAVSDMDGDGKPDIIVVNAGSNSVSILRYNPLFLTPPVITSFGPASAAVGAAVTIQGTGFNTTASNNIVFFGATRATVTAANTGKLSVTVPMGATYAAITVLNKTTGLAAFSSRVFQPVFTPGTGGITAATFAPKVDYPLGQGNSPVAIGDIDGDGKPDIVTSNNNSISVLRNTGHSGRGSFAQKVDVATFPSTIINLADIDGDGKLDIVLGNAVLLNTSTPGRISFAPKLDLTAAAFAVGDIDGDGKPDLIGIDNQDISVYVLRNSSSPGNISFDAKVWMYMANRYGKDVAVGDLDGDGKPDILVGSTAGNVLPTYISTLRNTSTPGNISFAPRMDMQIGTNTDIDMTEMTIGDIDGDGKPDLAVASGSGNAIFVLRNTGSPGTLSFAPEIDFPVYRPVKVAIGDIDGDGKPDLAVAKDAGVAVLRNMSSAGNLSFAAEVPFTIPDYGPSFGIAVGDLDGDGKPDVATTTETAAATVSVLNSNQTWPDDAGIKSMLLSTGSTLTYLSTSGNILQYSASVTAATTSLTVTPTASNPQATITVNGTPVTSGTASQSVALNTNPTIINIVVTAADGVTQKTYTISVYKNGSSNAGVDLKLSSGSLLTLFSNSNAGSVLNYYAAVLDDTVRVIPTAADPGAHITVNGRAVASGTASQNISLPYSPPRPVLITVQVTAQDGVTKRIYQIYVYWPSSDASFKSVQLRTDTSLSYLSSSLTFLSSSYNVDYYSASVPAGTASVTVTTVARYPGAPFFGVLGPTITVDALAVASGVPSQSIPLTGNPTIVTIQIIASDHLTTRTRSIAIYKNKASDAGLKSVVLSTGSAIIHPSTSNNVDYYYASVPPGITSLTLTPTASDPNATITVDGSAVISGTASQSIALDTNPTVVNIKVTAEDGINTQMRSITIYKNGASDARMKSIVLSTGPRMKRLDVLDNVYYYSATVPDTITSLTVTPTANDPNATITVDEVAVVSGTASQSIALGTPPIVINIQGTAQDGITTKTYSITVTRARPPLNSVYEPVSVTNPADSPQKMGEELTVHQYISPNGDGINDFLIIEGITSYPDNTLTIMNRSGQVVFEAKNYDNSTKVFDGHSTKTGVMQLPGTYFYSLDYSVKGVARHKTGFIVLKY